jgi:hypothetical protein
MIAAAVGAKDQGQAALIWVAPVGRPAAIPSESVYMAGTEPALPTLWAIS